MERNFLTPLTTDELFFFFDTKATKIIDDLLLTSTFFQPPEISEDQSLPVHIPKEHIEQFVVQAIGVEPCGAGSYPVDVIDRERKFGADVKMLSCKQRDGKLLSQNSGETSLAQKFSKENLDILFNTGKHEEIKDIWVEILNNKYDIVLKEGVTDLYYFFILRAAKEFFLTGCKLNLENIKYMSVQRATSESVFLDGILPPEFGNSKIYKAKKRLELRLTPSKWQDQHSIKFSEKSIGDVVKLRSLSETDYKNYWKNRSETFKRNVLNNQ